MPSFVSSSITLGPYRNKGATGGAVDLGLRRANGGLRHKTNTKQQG